LRSQERPVGTTSDYQMSLFSPDARVSMFRQTAWFLAIWTIASIGVPGCAGRKSGPLGLEGDMSHYRKIATEIEHPDICPTDGPALPPAPRTILTEAPADYWDMKLDEAMQLALANSRVLRGLGGTVLRSPGTTNSIHTPAIQETDPRYGVEAALSAFDAQFSAKATAAHNDRAINNSFFGGGTRLFQQDLDVFQTQLTKRTAQGTQLTVRHNTDYDANNAPGNQFPSAWNTNYETEFRQPLLQGAGAQYNRIAGVNGIPGFANGVLVARINTDISIADFEVGVRDFVADVENAYWDLYYAYRDLDAKIAARNSSLETWRRINALYQFGRRGGEAEKEAQAREQYFRYQEEVQNGLTGPQLEGTRTSNGSGGGTLRGISGVQVAERRLRLLLGLPITDNRLIRPADEPLMANIVFDWEEIVNEALARRAELRRQKWTIKRRELELIAARNYLLPSLDATGLYRWRGFGHDLYNPKDPNQMRFDNAYETLFTGNFQEWQLGMELNMPIGYRRGHAAVRNAQLQLARDRALLYEQERDVLHSLSNAVAEKERAFVVAQTTYNRRQAARAQLGAMQAAHEAERVPLDFVLEAQRRLAEADTRHYRALVEYAIAVRNVHFEKGSLLDYNDIRLAEGAWPGKAYQDAAKRDALRMRAGPLNYILRRPWPVSAGPVGDSPVSASRSLQPQQSDSAQPASPPAERVDTPPPQMPAAPPQPLGPPPSNVTPPGPAAPLGPAVPQTPPGPPASQLPVPPGPAAPPRPTPQGSPPAGSYSPESLPPPVVRPAPPPNPSRTLPAPSGTSPAIPFPGPTTTPLNSRPAMS
jgi:hypothetical protein